MQNGEESRRESTTQTRCLRGEPHQHNKYTCANVEGSRREKHYTNPLFARQSTPTQQITCANGEESRRESTTQTHCLLGKAHQHNK